MPMPDAIRELVAPILAGELLPEQDARVPAEPSPPSKLRFKFGLDEYEDEDCPGPLGKVSFARAARHVLYQFAGGPHDDKVPEHKYVEVGGPNGYLDLESRTGRQRSQSPASANRRPKDAQNTRVRHRGETSSTSVNSARPSKRPNPL